LLHPISLRRVRYAVIASAAKQSIARQEEGMDCFVARAPRNDVETSYKNRSIRKILLARA
jgi:hypothetical protein